MAKITFEDKVALNPQPSIAEKNKCTDANINEIKTCVNDNCTYSTNEICIGEWIDGKPIYRKVIEFTITGTTQMTIAHGISDLGWVVKCEITMFNQYNYFMAGALDISNVSVGSGNIYFTSAWPTGNAKAIIEYTKTTD